MSLHLNMRLAASRALTLLPDFARPAVTRFLFDRLNQDGGFADRSGRSDLYYTMFGLEALAALRADGPTDKVRAYLGAADAGKLDLVHLACLARCWANIPACPEGLPPKTCSDMLGRIEGYRARDGGYNPKPGSAKGTAYGCILAVGALQDLYSGLTDPAGVIRCVRSLRTGDGGYANEPGQPFGLTPATAAGVTLLAELGQPVESSACDWLLARVLADGGFAAAPAIPLGDLLSTATAVHALATAGVPLDSFRDRCVEFVSRMWSPPGGFRGHAADDTPDCEYTFYGLLALGHLAADNVV